MTDNFRPMDRARQNRVKQFDPFVHALTTIDENHRMVHDGFFYELWRGDTSLAAAASLELLLDVPAGTYPHLQDLSLEADVVPIALAIYEGTTTSADGTALPVFNKNRNSSNTPNTAITYAPTITDDGTEIKHASIVSPEGSSVIFSQSKAGEWILAPSTKYLVRVTNNNAGVAAINLTIGFYEIGYID